MYFDWIQNFKVNFISLTPITQTSCCSTTRRARASAEITATVGGVYCSWVIMVIRSMCAVFIHSWMLLRKSSALASEWTKVQKCLFGGIKARESSWDCPTVKVASNKPRSGVTTLELCYWSEEPQYQILIMYPPGSVGTRLCLSIKICSSLLIEKENKQKIRLSALWVRLSFKNIL